MRVIATATGYFDKVREAGEQFDVPQGTKGSWFVPVEKPGQADVKAKANKGKGDDLV